MKNEKKVYETPEVTKVEFDLSDRVVASGCTYANTEKLKSEAHLSMEVEQSYGKKYLE